MTEKNENTREQIKECLARLSGKMNIEKINIATIVKECGISRTLFYYYYEDMYALIEDLLSDDIEKAISESMRMDDALASIQHYIEKCQGYFPIIRKVLGTKYYEVAHNMVQELNLKYLRLTYADRFDGATPPKDVDFMLELLSDGLTSYAFAHCNDRPFDTKFVSETLHKMLIRARQTQQTAN